MSPAARLRAVVFDLDGLIFNTEELYQFVGEELLRRRDKTFPPELLDQTMGRPQRIALQLMIDWHQLDVSVDQLMLETAEVFATILGERLALMPGVSELLAALEAAGIPKAIATSSNRDFVADVLGRFQLTPRFQFILTGDDITHGKPHPEIYQLAAKRFRHSAIRNDGARRQPSRMRRRGGRRHVCRGRARRPQPHARLSTARRWWPIRCAIRASMPRWVYKRRQADLIQAAVSSGIFRHHGPLQPLPISAVLLPDEAVDSFLHQRQRHRQRPLQPSAIERGFVAGVNKLLVAAAARALEIAIPQARAKAAANCHWLTRSAPPK